MQQPEEQSLVPSTSKMSNSAVPFIGDGKSSESLVWAEAETSLSERPRTEEVRVFARGEYVSRGEYALFCEQLQTESVKRVLFDWLLDKDGNLRDASSEELFQKSPRFYQHCNLCLEGMLKARGLIFVKEERGLLD